MPVVAGTPVTVTFARLTGNPLLVIVIATLLILSSTVPANSLARDKSFGNAPPSDPTHRNFWLRGSAAFNWNLTSPGPLISVVDGDSVSISYNSVDNAMHTWFIDTNNNNIPDMGEVFSSTVVTTTAYFNFTFTARIGSNNILSAGDYQYKCNVHPTLMFGTFRIAVAPSAPDYTISATPVSPSSITLGGSGTSTVTLSSLNGFAGPVTVTSTVTAGPAGTPPVLTPTPNTVTLASAGTVSFTLSVATTTSTTKGAYTITVTGLAGSTSNAPGATHSVTLTLTVVAPDFTIASNPTSLTVAQGTSQTLTITLTSLNTFQGNVNLTAIVLPVGPSLSLNPKTVTLSSGSTATSTLTVSTASAGAYSSPTPTGSYTVTVNATSGSIIHSLTIAVTVNSGSSGIAGLPSSVLIGIIAVIVAAIIVAFFVIRRSRTKT